jgi:hypothetical protein
MHFSLLLYPFGKKTGFFHNCQLYKHIAQLTTVQFVNTMQIDRKITYYESPNLFDDHKTYCEFTSNQKLKKR